tara:strand:+ start:456 stop:800 length:345 start_codon:yes stop_codon:yes gene_type:complete
MQDIVKELQENQELREVLRSWQEVGYLNLIPSYQDNRDLKHEKFKAVINAEQYSHTITVLRDEIATLRQTWLDLEEVPDEDLWQDGELDAEQVMNHIYEHVIVKGDWKLMRSKL